MARRKRDGRRTTERRLVLASLLAVATTGCAGVAETGTTTQTVSTAESTGTRTATESTDTPTTTDTSPTLDATVVRQPDDSAPGRIELRLHNGTARTLGVRFGNVPPLSDFSSGSIDGKRLLLLPEIERQATNPPVDELVPAEPTDRTGGGVPCWTATAEVYPVQFFTDVSLSPGDSVVRPYTALWAADAECGPGTFTFERTTSDEADVRLDSTLEVTVAGDGSLSAEAETELV
ncbi:hypothetical protein RYH80_12640 [Halobaculum sp. MBLA0147]|uniref:hypothetical protein n=1 Tax=Halobaculum sp. MBLA0147 TaxID=3079934 RepID=UPI0035265486